MITEIIHNLYIGTVWDSIHDKTDWVARINVAEWNNFSETEQSDLICTDRPLLHIPFMKYGTEGGKWWDCWADINLLNLIGSIIDPLIKKGPVLVHCAAGRERSPLLVIWYLYSFYDKALLLPWNSSLHNVSLEEVFEFVQKRRPQIENRLDWIKKGELK